MILSLPVKTQVNKVIPKNAFDDYTNTKQKRKFIDLVSKLTWINKLSFETVNIKGKMIKEIQVFQLDLKSIDGFQELIQIINKAIPYHIIFCVYHKEKVLFTTSQIHPNPSDNNLAVIDWTFSSKWTEKLDNGFKLNLEKNLDFVFFDFCKQILGIGNKISSIGELIGFDKNRSELSKSIKNLQTAINKTKQFNKRVQLNIELQAVNEALQRLEDFSLG